MVSNSADCPGRVHNPHHFFKTGINAFTGMFAAPVPSILELSDACSLERDVGLLPAKSIAEDVDCAQHDLRFFLDNRST